MDKTKTSIVSDSPLRKMVLVLALCTPAVVACTRIDQGGAQATNPRAHGDLHALYDRLAVGDRIEFAESVLGSPDRVSTSTIFFIDCTTYIYVDLLSGKSVVLRFSLGGRLISKSFELKPPFSINLPTPTWR